MLRVVGSIPARGTSQEGKSKSENVMSMTTYFDGVTFRTSKWGYSIVGKIMVLQAIVTSSILVISTFGRVAKR